MKLGALLTSLRLDFKSILCWKLSKLWLFSTPCNISECSVVGWHPGSTGCPRVWPARPSCCVPYWHADVSWEVLEDVYLYCPFFTGRRVHTPLMLYLQWLRNSCTVFFGFTKLIKRPCETNLALTISLFIAQHTPSCGLWQRVQSTWRRRRSGSPTAES